MIDRNAWLEARRKGIGGTDAPAILGLSRYRTPIDVWTDKLGLSPEKPQTAPMKWGLALEDAIAKAYSEETGNPVRKVGMRRAKHVRDFPMIGSIDRMTVGVSATRGGEYPRVVEIKTSRSSDGWAGRDEWRDLPPEKRVPADYYVQVQHYLEVVQAPVADVAVLFSGSDFRIIEIPRDQDFGADLRVEEGAFWRDYVVAEVQPPVTAEDLDYLARKYPTSADEEKVATAEVAAMVDDLLAIDDQRKELERARGDLRAKLEEYIGTAAKLLTPRASVRWKSHDVTRTAWKEVAACYLASATSLLAVLNRIKEDDPDDWDRVDAIREALDAVPTLYAQTTAERPFVVDRKKEGVQ